MIGMRRKVSFVRAERTRRPSNVSGVEHAPRVPRIARLVALAVRFDRLLREGQVKSLGELARLARVSQPRATQIVGLSLLAPSIIEELLFLSSVRRGREDIHETLLRPIARIADWHEQRRLWRKIRSDRRPSMIDRADD